jgi:hypothetical protein
VVANSKVRVDNFKVAASSKVRPLTLNPWIIHPRHLLVPRLC